MWKNTDSLYHTVEVYSRTFSGPAFLVFNSVAIQQLLEFHLGTAVESLGKEDGTEKAENEYVCVPEVTPIDVLYETLADNRHQ